MSVSSSPETMSANPRGCGRNDVGSTRRKSISDRVRAARRSPTAHQFPMNWRTASHKIRSVQPHNTQTQLIASSTSRRGVHLVFGMSYSVVVFLSVFALAFGSSPEFQHKHHNNEELLRVLQEVNGKCDNITRLYTLSETSVLGVPLYVIEFSTNPGHHELSKLEGIFENIIDSRLMPAYHLAYGLGQLLLCYDSKLVYRHYHVSSKL